MKSLIKIFAVFLLIFMSFGIEPPKSSAQAAVSFQLFYDNLSPYGTWVDYPSYGYVWIPSAGPGFYPYSTAGHWAFTGYGWMWVSDYSWGWAPFHYGRWLFDPIYGWIWVPGSDWGPAWVVWGGAPGYYGWAPIAPGISINVVLGGGYRPPARDWVFVPETNMGGSNLGHYYAPRSDNERLLKTTTVINKTTEDNSTHVRYIAGPDSKDVQQKTGKQVEPVKLRESEKPGQKVSGGDVSIYRPQIQKTTASGDKPQPKQVEELSNVKPLNERQANKSGEQANPKNVEKGKATPGKQAPVKQQPQQRQEQPQQKEPSHDVNPAPKNEQQGNDLEQQDQRDEAENAQQQQEMKENQQQQEKVAQENKQNQQAPPPKQSNSKKKKPK